MYSKGVPKMRNYLHSYKLLLTALPLLGVLAITACTNPHTPAGSEGYVFENPRLFGEGGYQGIVEGPGNFGVSPWRNQAINIDVRPITFSEPFQILAQDDLNVSFQIHVVLQVQPGTVQSVVERYSADQWYDRYVKEPFRSFARQAIQAYASHELKTQRPTIAEQIQANLAAYLEGSPFEIINLSIGNIDYPAGVAKAVEKKLAAMQLLQEKETQKEIAQKDAEIRIEEAKGIAQAQEIINATLTENYLQHEAINAQKTMANSPNHTTVYIPVGSNGIPIVYTAGGE